MLQSCFESHRWAWNRDYWWLQRCRYDADITVIIIVDTVNHVGWGSRSYLSSYDYRRTAWWSKVVRSDQKDCFFLKLFFSWSSAQVWAWTGNWVKKNQQKKVRAQTMSIAFLLWNNCVSWANSAIHWSIKHINTHHLHWEQLYPASHVAWTHTW